MWVEMESKMFTSFGYNEQNQTLDFVVHIVWP